MITIAELRAKNNKMSQDELAKKLGVTQSAVSRWEKNIETMPAPILIKMCLFFGVSADDLLGISEKQKFLKAT